LAEAYEIAATYDYMDSVFRATFGEHADITCALYNGEAKTLEQAQRDKHAYIFEALRFKRGQRILDIGCGWGPLLDAARRLGCQATGLTLSPRQAEACRRAGLDVRVLDWRDADSRTLGTFDAVASVGAFEHFCSPEEHEAGEQEGVYARFFELCANLLGDSGRLYLQTMTLGERAPALREVSLSAPRGSDAYVLAVLMRFYPGSFPPVGLAQIERCASPWFSVRSVLNGRADYLRTMQAWNRIWVPTPRKLLALMRTLRPLLRDPDWKHRCASLWHGYNQESFRRLLLDHFRIVLERRQGAGAARTPR
jgi:cyclopropane-fatty-acyl-phospholipid synthase